MTTDHWLKSSHSSANGDCVELTRSLDRIRDSKDPDGPTLNVNVRELVRAVKDGRFDH
ncbi:protein of unknown function [Saccharopolyspora flava]|uniref:DUF397 domain-containing protein n=2 Tax=Saccharopolyspora flava TaxID=95161 RepID=A0A1I6RTA9_9PSEU|nr:protein of unknown function [Saccharopolyspora flava]